jgi:putative tryptophan/tyrosine transport system substrate-binding protein
MEIRKRWCVGVLMALLALCFSSSLYAVDIGVAWEGKSGMANTVIKGFNEGIKGSGFNIEYQKDLASVDELVKVMNRFQKEKAGMVILRSTGAELLIKTPPTIPTFLGACNNPAKVGVVKNMKAPEGKITGVSYYVPGIIHVKLIKTILPEVKSVMLLLDKDHPSAPIENEETKEGCAALKITYHGKMC